MDNYSGKDAAFDAEQQGRCPICGRSRDEGCRHCSVCGVVDCDGSCLEDMDPDVDDSVKYCPDCERPNQFGELCQSCLDAERDASYLDEGA